MLNGFQEKCLWLDTIICMANLPLRFTAFHLRTLCLYVRSCYLHKYCCHVCIHTQTPSSPNSCFSSPPSQVCTSPASSSSYIFMFVCIYQRDWRGWGGGGQNWIIHRSVLHHQLPSFQTERLKRSQICHYNDFIFTCCVAAIKEVMDVSHDPFFFLNGNLPTTWINQFFFYWVVGS